MSKSERLGQEIGTSSRLLVYSAELPSRRRRHLTLLWRGGKNEPPWWVKVTPTCWCNFKSSFWAVCGQSLGSRSLCRNPTAHLFDIKLPDGILSSPQKCHFLICIGPFLHINVILFLVYICLLLYLNFHWKLIRLQSEPAPWGKMIQLLPLVVGSWGCPQRGHR